MNTHTQSTKISLRLPDELLRLLFEIYNPKGFLGLSQTIKQALLVAITPAEQVNKGGA